MTNEIETPKRTRKIAVVGTTTVGANTQTGRISMSAPCIKEVDKAARVRKPKPSPTGNPHADFAQRYGTDPKEAYSAEELSDAQKAAIGRTKTTNPPTQQPKLAPNGIVLDENNCHILPSGDCIGGVTAGADPCICDLFPKSHRRSRKPIPRGNRSLRVVDVIFRLESPASGVVTVVLKDENYDLTEAQLRHCDFSTKARLASGVRAIIAHNLKHVPGVTFNVKWDGK